MGRQEPGPTWPTFWAGPPNVPGLVFEHLKHKDKRGLRGTSALSRTAVNAGVRKAVIREKADLQGLAELQLHKRFPNLENVVLIDGLTSEGNKVVKSIVEFAVATLSELPILASVDLVSCRDLDVPGAALALTSCTNLQELRMPDGAQISNVTLQLLAKIKSLTSLVLLCSDGFDAAGLQHLSSLQELKSLECNNCPGITDASVAALAQLKGLTCLNLFDCKVQGSTLAQLTALSNLQELSGLPTLDDPQHLTALQSLTTLTKLDMSDEDIWEACKGILELPNLQHLTVASIDLESAPTASMCSKLTDLILDTFTLTVARMLPLPELQCLEFHYTPDEDDLSRQELAAAIASQTSVTILDMQYLDDGYGLADEDIITIATSLKQLQELVLTFDNEGSVGQHRCLQSHCSAA